MFSNEWRTKYLPKMSILLFLLAALFLSGCIYVQSNVAIYGDEEWQGVQAMQLSAEFAELMEQGGTSTTETTEDGATLTTETSVDTEGLDEWLANAENISNREDINVAFEQVQGEDGSQSFVLQASGRSYEDLNEVFFNGEADISVETVDGQQQITIRHDVSETTGGTGAAETELSPAELEMQMQMMEAMGLGFIFRISGGEIINSNATRVEGNTAVWENPTTIEVTLTKAAQFSPQTISLSAPPPGSGFSLEAFESMMESVEGDLGLPAQDVESSEPMAEPAPEEETSPETTTGDTTAPATTEEITAPPPEAEETGPEESEPPAAAPQAEEQPLPASGAVLSQNNPAGPFVLAGLILVVLVGAGIGAGIRTFKKQ